MVLATSDLTCPSLPHQLLNIIQKIKINALQKGISFLYCFEKMYKRAILKQHNTKQVNIYLHNSCLISEVYQVKTQQTQCPEMR